MFEIKMTIEIPGLPEALNALAGAIGKQPEFVCHQHGGNNHHIDNAGVVNVDFPAAPAPAESYTVEELSRAGAALIDAGKMPQLLALLGKFGVQAVTQLPKEAYSAFGAELKALGAQL